MSKKGRLEEILSKAIHFDDPKLYWVHYRDFESFVKVSLPEFLVLSQNFQLIPAHRVIKITREEKLLYSKMKI